MSQVLNDTAHSVPHHHPIPSCAYASLSSRRLDHHVDRDKLGGYNEVSGLVWRISFLSLGLYWLIGYEDGTHIQV